MARDTSVLPDGQARYDKIKARLGEAQADAWFDKTVGALGVSPTAPVPPSQPVTVSPVPTPIAMQAATGAGEMAPKAGVIDLVTEEQKALEAATKRFVDAGIPTKEKVKQDIQLQLANEGLSPFGAGAAAYNKRLVEEINKSEFAERKAQEDVATARRPLVTGFDRRAPIVGESTLAKSPQLVADMGALEALGAAFRPQVIETPDEASARLTAERQQRETNKQIEELAKSQNIDIPQASKKFYAELQSDFLVGAKKDFALYDIDQQNVEARKNYLNFLQSNLPEEYVAELRRPEEEAAFGIAGSQSTGVSAGKAQIADAAAMSLAFLSSDKYDPEVYKSLKQKAGITPNTEAVIESLPMTTVRDLGGLMRFAINPAMDAIMYDVEPGTGKEVTPGEFGFVPRERSGGKEERAFGRSYISPKDSGISGKVKEIAVEIASGRTLGDDLASQQAVRQEDEMAYRGVGMLAELALPINPLELAKLVPGGKAVTAALTEIPPAAYNKYALNKQILAPLQKAGAEGRILGDEIKKSASLKKWLIDSNSMAAQQAVATTDDLISLRLVSEGRPSTSSRVNAVMDAPNVVDKQKLASKILNDIAGAPENTVTKTAAQMVQKVPVAELGNEATRLQVANAAKQGLSQTTLGQWTFATPRIVTTTKWAEKNLNEVYDTANNTYNSLIRVTTDASGARSVVAKTDFANLSKTLEDYAAISRPITGTAEGSKINEVLGSIKAGDKLTVEQYALVQRIVDDGAVLITAKAVGGLGEGAPIYLTQTGRAFESALVPKEMQSSLQTGKQLIANVFPVKEPEIIPTAVRELKDNFKAYLQNVDSQYAATVSGLGKGGLKPEQIWGQLVARALSTDARFQKFGAFAPDIQKLTTLENGRDAAKSILGLYFGEASSLKSLAETPRGREIIRQVDVLLQDPNVSLLNPDTFMSEIASLAASLERKIPELADNKAKNLTDVVIAYVAEQSKNRALAGYFNSQASRYAAETFVSGGPDVAGLPNPQKVRNAYTEALSGGLQSSLAGRNDGIPALRQSLIDKGFSQSDVQTIMQKVGPKFIEDINRFHMDVLRSIGGLPISPAEAMTRLNLGFRKIGDNIQLMPVNLSNNVKQMQSIMSKADKRDIGNFALTVSEIEKVQPGFTAKILNDFIAPFGGAVYRSLIEGMLAGRALPNYTYISENVITTPLIAAVTNPTYIDAVMKNIPIIGPKSIAGAVGAGDFGKYHGYSYNIFDAARTAPDAVAMTTASGKKLTNTELLDMWRRANIGSSGQSVVLGPDVTGELQALAGRITGGAPATVKKLVRDFAPSGTMSIPSTSAANADMAFRMSLFREALRRGATETEAATIARETLLDYGTLNRILPEEFGPVKRGFLFLSFQAAASVAIMKAMLRGDTRENVLRLARFHKDLAQWQGDNEYADQPQLEAMWLGSLEDIGGKPAQMTYLRDPIVGQLFWAAGLADSVANITNNPAGELQNIIEATGFNPTLQLLQDINETRANQSIPARQIALLKATGLFDNAVDAFNIKERKPEEMRIGEPTFDGRQYTLNSEADAKKYVTTMYGLTLLGWNRMLNDWTNAAIAGGIVPEGAYMARYTPGNNKFEGVQSEGNLLNGALYFIVRGRATRVPTAIEEQDRQIQKELKKLKDIQ